MKYFTILILIFSLSSCLEKGGGEGTVKISTPKTPKVVTEEQKVSNDETSLSFSSDSNLLIFCMEQDGPLMILSEIKDCSFLTNELPQPCLEFRYMSLDRIVVHFVGFYSLDEQEESSSFNLLLLDQEDGEAIVEISMNTEEGSASMEIMDLNEEDAISIETTGCTVLSEELLWF